MSETEKITINLGAVDLGHIDLLVEQGFYSNRTDLIRTAIRNQIGSHADEIKKIMNQRTLTIGVEVLTKSSLESLVAQQKKIRLHVVGLLTVQPDVTVSLIQQAVESVKVYGLIKASSEIKHALNALLQ